MLEVSRPYYLYDKPCDMRKSFNALGALVTGQMGLALLSGAGFVFINKRKTHLKLLMWEGDGFGLYYKRLERGTFEHPNSGNGYELSYEKLLLILRGIETNKIEKRKRFSYSKQSWLNLKSYSSAPSANALLVKASLIRGCSSRAKRWRPSQQK